MLTKRFALLPALMLAFAADAAHHETADPVDNDHRSAENRERDGDRKPAEILEFAGLGAGDVVLDWGAGGGYWTEVFAGQVGPEGKVYAQQRAGERYDARKDALAEQFEPFGNIELMPMDSGANIPLEDDTVDLVMLSYLYHHMHYAEGEGESLPASTSAILEEFKRVLRPGGTLIVIEHAAAEGSGRAESAGWHRTPAGTAREDITGAGFEFVDEAPEVYHNPDDDMASSWGDAGLRGNTTSFVHKYRLPE